MEEKADPKILIIDDEIDMLATLKDFLTERGFDVVTAIDGNDGMRVFIKENPDLVICDLKMPNKDGFQFLKELRAGGKWVPAIILSALNTHADIARGYKSEADYYLTKPPNLDELLKGISIMLSVVHLRKS